MTEAGNAARSFNRPQHIYFGGPALGNVGIFAEQASIATIYKNASDKHKVTQFTQPWLARWLSSAAPDARKFDIEGLDVQMIEGPYTQVLKPFMSSSTNFHVFPCGLTGLGAFVDLLNLRQTDGNLEITYHSPSFWEPILMNLGALIGGDASIGEVHEDTDLARKQTVQEYYDKHQQNLDEWGMFDFTESDKNLTDISELMFALVTKFIEEHKKTIILHGKDHWTPFDRIMDHLIKEGFVDPKIKDLYTVFD